ncbi:MAG: antitoxin family protein [Chloroflexota bacterium]
MSAIKRNKSGQTNSTIDAVYEHGVFRVLDPETIDLADGQKVRLVVEPTNGGEGLDSLELLGRMYDGLPEEKIAQIESIIVGGFVV